MKPIPVETAVHLCNKFDYDQVVIIARKVHDGVGNPEDSGEHVTTAGATVEHCRVAARIGDFIKHKIMRWPRTVLLSANDMRKAWAAWGGVFIVKPGDKEFTAQIDGANLFVMLQVLHQPDLRIMTREEVHGYFLEWFESKGFEPFTVSSTDMRDSWYAAFEKMTVLLKTPRQPSVPRVTLDQMHAMFETWQGHGRLKRLENGQYESMAVQQDWNAWRAACLAIGAVTE